MNTSVTDFTKLVPGFDFLQGLVQNAGSALPSIGQWVAPTLNPEELEKRIEELRTVQFWLEQNARMLGATIQALEVQRMTLSTLKTMNVQMADLRESMRIKLPEAAEPAPEPPAAPAPMAWHAPATHEPPPAAAKAPPAGATRKAAGKATGKAAGSGKGPANGAAASAPGIVDPMQWWGALTKQFGELAASALKDSAGEAARELAGSMVKQSIDAAGQTLNKAAAIPGKVVGKALAAAAPAPATKPARPAPRKAATSARPSPAARPRSGGR